MINSQIVIDHLIKIMIGVESQPFDSIKDYKQIWIKAGTFIYLDDAGFEEERLLLKEIFKDAFVKTNFPRDYIEDRIHGIISGAFKLPRAKRKQFLKKQIAQLRHDLEKEIKNWIIIVPIENFKLNKAWLMGEVKFYPNKNFNKVIDLLKANLKNNKVYTKNQKKAIVNEQLRILRESSTGFIGVFAEVKIKGILDIAQKEAMNKVRLALNILRLYNLPSDESNREYFGISGEVIRRNLRYTMRREENTLFLHPIIERTGFLFPFELSKERIQFMNKNGFRKLRTIFSNDKRTEIENRLLTSIYWYGESINTEIYFDEKKVLESKRADFGPLEYFNLNQRYIKLMIALEAILLFDENESVQNNIAERTAFLLSKKYEERKEIKKTIKKYYKIRSGIVHHGGSSLSLSDLHLLSWIVQNMIFTLVKLLTKSPMKRKEDLQQYFEKLKLS